MQTQTLDLLIEFFRFMTRKNNILMPYIESLCTTYVSQCSDVTSLKSHKPLYFNCNRRSATPLQYVFLYHSVYLTRQIILLVLGNLLMNEYPSMDCIRYLVHRLKQFKKLPSCLIMTLLFNF